MTATVRHFLWRISLVLAVSFLCVMSWASASFAMSEDEELQLANVAKIIVTVRGGTAKYVGADVPLPDRSVTVDLLRLPQFGPQLGFLGLLPGKITEFRLHQDQSGTAYVELHDGVQQPLTLPSGVIRIVGPFDVLSGGAVVLTLPQRKAIWLHTTARDNVWLLRPLVHARVAVGFERSNYSILYTTSNMPDPQFDGMEAELEIRRVRPVFENGGPAHAALVLVHGVTIDGATAFDLGYEDYSLMFSLALEGIDTFAVNMLGLGGSRLIRNHPLENPCNASLPRCPITTTTSCAPVVGECDCPGVVAGGVLDQQGSPIYLNPNPLASRCAHTSNTRFQRSTNQVVDLDRAVEDARARSGHERVSLLGYSTGGATVGEYLNDSNQQAKISRAIFVASTFSAPNVPSGESPPFPSWPLGVFNQNEFMANFNVSPTCPAQHDPLVPHLLWSALQERDPIGAAWGPNGLQRFPIVTRGGWGPEASQRISTPILALHGLLDNVVNPVTSVAIYRNSPAQMPDAVCSCPVGMETCAHSSCESGYTCKTLPAPGQCRLDSRVLRRLACASHALLWESCAEAGCTSPHAWVARNVKDFVLTGVVE